MSKIRSIIKKKHKDWICAYLLIAPVFLGLIVFYIYPFFRSFYNSFLEVGRFGKTSWGGMINYKTLFQDNEFVKSLMNTLYYIILTVPVGICISLILAALLNSKIRGKSLYRVIYFLPSVTMSTATALVWKWIYNGDFGMLNGILNILGITGKSWLTDNSTALIAVAIVGIWMSFGYNMIILLAGMQGISRSYYEAASIDGAGGIRQFYKITVPLVTPTIFFVMITSLISGFQVFDIVYMMIGKSSTAYNASQTIVRMYYMNAFDYANKGYASAIAMVIFVVIMIITVIQMRLQKKWVNYE